MTTRAVRRLLPAAVLVLVGCGARGESRLASTGADVAQGKQLIRAYGCGGCHVVPGVSGARGMVGPPLTRFGLRVYIAGQVANTPRNLVRWITVPQSIEPGTAMPNLGVTENEATSMAAYLYTLR